MQLEVVKIYFEVSENVLNYDVSDMSQFSIVVMIRSFKLGNNLGIS